MADSFREKWAILFGATQYKYLGPLRYCTRDAIEIGKALRRVLEFEKDHVLCFGEFQKEQLTDLDPALAQPPELTTFWERFGGFVRSGRIREDDLLLFYFSGHGVRVKRDYLLPLDGVVDDLRHTAIDVEELLEGLTDTSCKNIVIFLDACREVVEGAKAGVKGATAIGGEASKALMQRKGIISFFSCEPEDLSFEIEELAHSSFTYCLLQAIQNSECTTVGEVYTYLLNAVPQINRQYKKRPQKPYAVIEPAEKSELPIFASRLKQRKIADRYDEMMEVLLQLVDSGELAPEYYGAALELLIVAKSKAGALTDEENSLVEWIKRLCAKIVTPKVFEVTWQMKRKRRIVEVVVKKDLGKLQ